MTTKYLPAKAVAARYGVADRTVDRWLQTNNLPPPVYIQKRRYWLEHDLDKYDASRQAATEAA